MRIVSITAELKGQTALLMHNPRLSDPLNEYARNLSKINHKPAKSKTEEDHAAASRIEWEGGLYYHEVLGPVIPYELVRRSLMNGASMARQGTGLGEAFVSLPDQLEFPLAYKGPRTIGEMWDSGDFLDRRPAGINKNRVQRSRPRFNPWTLTVNFLLDTTRLDLEALAAAGEAAGRFKGVGDGRSIGFGRYAFAMTNVEKL